MRRLMNLGALCGAGLVNAETSPPPSDSDIQQALAAFDSELRAYFAKSDDAPDDGLDGSYTRHLAPLSVETMTPEQIARLPLMFFQFGDGMRRGLERLEELHAADADDLRALIRLVDLNMAATVIGYKGDLTANPERLQRFMQRIVGHSRLQDAARDGTAEMVVSRLVVLGDDEPGRESRRRAVQRLVRLAGDDNAAPRTVIELATRWSEHRDLGFEPAVLAALRDELVAALRSSIEQLKAEQ